MKTLLIVFVVILFLLTLLSSFGGSIRPAEPFYDASPAQVLGVGPSKDQRLEYNSPVPPTYDTYTNDMPTYDTYTNEMPTYDTYVNDMPSGMNQSMPPMPPGMSGMMPQGGGPKTVQLLGGSDMMQKIDVPEPFVNDDDATGAPF